MSQPTTPASAYAAMAPLGAHCPGAQTKTVTSSDTSLLMSALAAGTYILWTVERESGVTVWMKFGAAASVPNPTTGALVDGLMGFSADDVATLVIQPEDLTAGDDTLHLISTSTTVTVCFQRLG
jgi:hypothetical protein